MEINVLEFLEKTAKLYPNKIAIRDTVGEITFFDLQVESKKVGCALMAWKLFGKTVPVFMEKGILALTTFLGIVYAGGCYTFLNPAQPNERVKKILEIVESPIVITDPDHLHALEEINFKGTVVLAENLLNTEFDAAGLQEIRAKMIDTDPLYVNFTSGSTGIPKGVVVGHRSVIEFIHHFTATFKITSSDIIGNQAPFDFDVSVKDIYSMLMTGATMYIIPKEYFAFPKKLLDIIEYERITTLIWAVSALCMITSLRGFSYKIPATINKVLFSGEVMPVKHLTEWRRALPNALFVNLYGPTEITCNCTYYVITDDSIGETVIPIGKAFPNERVFLLNGSHEVLEANVPGELCVSGSALALGYFKDAEKTNKVFVHNPLHNSHNELIYRTGDMAYYRSDGNLVYIGRKDFQIKHMGHRIELGEIETFIGALPDIERACCLYDNAKDQIIAIYQGNAVKKEIKAELRKKLIKYMLPERYINIEHMPLTPNGKIDRKKLEKKLLG